MRSARRHLLALGFVVLVAPLQAQDAPRPAEIRGFGSWSYGRTNQNIFLSGSPEGDYRLVSLTLNISKRLDEKLSLHAQGEISESHDATRVNLSYAFADYKLNDHLSLRIGQVKHPFGIYTEVFAVGTLRPFIDLPQGFYGPVGFAGESYKGIGASGTVDVGAWIVAYDAYTGGNDLRKFAVPEEFFKGSTLQVVSQEFELQSTRNVIGGRVVLQTPIQGLSFGSSSYTGTLNEPASNRRTVIAGQVGYRSNALTLESEIAHEDQVNDERATGGYVLAAYRPTPEWQVGAQFNDLTNQFFGANLAAAPSLQEHREAAFVVSRWVSRAFVIKAEYHRVQGNRFAMPHPEDLIATVAAKELRLTTHLFRFGAQFTF
jgi:hypothetical protein